MKEFIEGHTNTWLATAQNPCSTISTAALLVLAAVRQAPQVVEAHRFVRAKLESTDGWERDELERLLNRHAPPTKTT